MSARTWHAVKGTALVFVALVAWIALYITVGHAWFVATITSGGPVGTAGLWAREAIANLPTLAYFVVAGALLFYFSGPFRTVWWAVAFGTTAMIFKTVTRDYTYGQGPELVDVGVLVIDLLVPCLLAILGAIAMRSLLAHLPGPRRAT